MSNLLENLLEKTLESEDEKLTAAAEYVNPSRIVPANGCQVVNARIK